MKKKMFFALAIIMVFAACQNNKKVEDNGDKIKEDSSKVTETKKEPTTQEKLIGEWKIDSFNNNEKISEKEKSKIIKFNSDSSGIFEDEKIKWFIVEKDSKSILVMKNDKNEEDGMEIKALDEKKLILYFALFKEEYYYYFSRK